MNMYGIRRAWALDVVFAMSLFIAATAQPADIVKPQPRKKINVPAIRIAYSHPGMTEPRVINRSNQNPGVIVGDTLEFTAVLVSGTASLESSRFSWTGSAVGEGGQIYKTFDSAGSDTLTLNVFDRNSNRVKSFAATTRVRYVGPEKETDICPSVEFVKCTAAAADAGLAESWAFNGDMAESLGFPRGECTVDDGKCNAAKHAYWNVLMVRDTGDPFASRLAVAHERYSAGFIFFGGVSGLNAGSAHNSVVMDLDNNLSGRAIASTINFTSSLPLGDSTGKTIVSAAVKAGFVGSLPMTKLNTSSDVKKTNPEGSGLLEPTNQ